MGLGSGLLRLQSSFNVYFSKNNLLSRSHDFVNGPKQREAESLSALHGDSWME